MSISAERTHDRAVAGLYREFDPYRVRDVKKLQDALASAQALVRVQAAQLKATRVEGGKESDAEL